jgi:hypothetical protein
MTIFSPNSFNGQQISAIFVQKAVIQDKSGHAQKSGQS